MKIKSLFIASALLLSVAAFAQETNKDASGKRIYGPYETNKFWDNWFISLGPGLNLGFDKSFESMTSGGKVNSEWGTGIGVDVEVGKWITPCSGVRIGWTGLKSSSLPTEFKEFPGNFNYNYIHGEFLWNVSNQFAGYKETRTVNVVPYASMGVIVSNFTKVVGDPRLNAGFGIGGGIMVPIRCSNVVSIVPDLRLIGVIDGDETSVNSIGGQRLSGMFSANVSVMVNLGKNNWTRKATSLAGAAAALAAAEAARNAMQAEKDQADAARAAADDKAARLAAENEDLKKLLEEAGNNTGLDLAEYPAAAYFELGKAKLSEKELAHIDYIIRTSIANKKDVKFIVTGSADKFAGTAKRNSRLAELRAKYLIDLLTNKYGLCADNFSVTTTVVDGNKPLARAVFIGK